MPLATPPWLAPPTNQPPWLILVPASAIIADPVAVVPSTLARRPYTLPPLNPDLTSIDAENDPELKFSTFRQWLPELVQLALARAGMSVPTATDDVASTATRHSVPRIDLMVSFSLFLL